MRRNEKKMIAMDKVLFLLDAIPNIEKLTYNPSIFSEDVISHDCDSCERRESYLDELYDPDVCKDCWIQAIESASE